MPDTLAYDATTVRAALDAGSNDAWAAIIQHTQRYLLGVLRDQGCDPSEADELVQLTYVRAWERRRQFTDGTFHPRALLAWLATIVANAWRDLARQRARHTPDGRVRKIFQAHCDLSRANLLAYEGVPDPQPTAEAAHVRAEARAEARAHLARLTATLPPSHQRIVPYLLDDRTGGSGRGYQGRPVVDMRALAAAHGQGYSAAKSVAHRTRLGLRRAWLAERAQEEA